MDATGDLRWGIAAVNLRAADATQFASVESDCAAHDGYFIKSYSATGDVALRRVRSHRHFADWSADPSASEALLSEASVHLVTITVTESGYYTDPDGNLNTDDATIRSELDGGAPTTVYAYLRAALAQRAATSGAPLTIACCDNIRQNGKMLQRNLLSYLQACQETDLVAWVTENVAFPCSMVDRITPRSPAALSAELTSLIGKSVDAPVMAEDFTQWVLQSTAAAPMPDLSRIGVTVTDDVNPFEETKIRVLNGGHTALAYIAALERIETFDAAMRVPHLREHFLQFERVEVLPALTLELPFSKADYLDDRGHCCTHLRRRDGKVSDFHPPDSRRLSGTGHHAAVRNPQYCQLVRVCPTRRRRKDSLRLHRARLGRFESPARDRQLCHRSSTVGRAAHRPP